MASTHDILEYLAEGDDDTAFCAYCGERDHVDLLIPFDGSPIDVDRCKAAGILVEAIALNGAIIRGRLIDGQYHEACVEDAVDAATHRKGNHS